MNYRIYAFATLATTLFLAGCEGDDGVNGSDGTDGADGTDGLNALITVYDVPVGDAVCLGGGQAIDSGLDTNRNGILDDDEVQATEYFECAVTPTLRALHASPDAPKVNIIIDEVEALSAVDFNQGSNFVGVGQAENVTETGAEVNVQLEGILPGDDEIVLDATLPLAFGTETTVIASGTIEGEDFGPILVENPIGEPIVDGSFRAQIVHAAPGAPAVDVYVTAVGGDLVNPVNGLTPLPFGEDTGRLEVPEGTYQIRVVAPILGPDPVYNLEEITLPAGADLMIVATDNVFLGDSAVQLIVLDGQEVFPLYDSSTPAGAVAVHLSEDAGPVDILADPLSTTEIEAIKLVENVSYTQVCELTNIGAPENYTLSVVLTGDTSSVLDIPFEAEVNEASTVIVSGLVATANLQAIPLDIDGRSIFTETKIRLTHGSPATPNVDIYLLPEGVAIGDEGVAPDYPDVPFGASTPVLSIDPEQNYDVYVTVAGDTAPAISVTGFNPAPGQVLDIIARDATGEETLPQAEIIDYDAIDECVVGG